MPPITLLWLKALCSRERSETRAKRRPVECCKLRIDLNNGSAALEYRIEDGRVEHRSANTLPERNAEDEVKWERLTPEALRSHVMTRSVVAYWLSHRLGIDALRRACGYALLSAGDEASERSRSGREITATHGPFEPITE